MDPKFSNVSGATSDTLTFTLSGVNVSLANAIRRTILTDIPTTVIRTELYKENDCEIEINTSRFHNEIVKHRLSCIPIHLAPEEATNWTVEIDVENTGDAIMWVTTEHFRLVGTDGVAADADLLRRVFPPCSQTGYFIDFLRLRPRVGDVAGERIKLRARLSVGTARENQCFNVVSKCTYWNTEDREHGDREWAAMEARLGGAEVDFHKHNFNVLNRQRYYVPDSFEFAIETLGYYTNAELVRRAAAIINGRIQRLIDGASDSGGAAPEVAGAAAEEEESRAVMIIPSNNIMKNSFDIVLFGEDYTVGKVIEFMIYELYYKGDKSVVFCGFNKAHPLDDESVIRVAFDGGEGETVRQFDKSAARDVFIKAAQRAQQVFTEIANGIGGRGASRTRAEAATDSVAPEKKKIIKKIKK